MLTAVTGSILLEASYIDGHHEEARFPCEVIEMTLNFSCPTLRVRGVAVQHLVALRWTPDRISFVVPDVAQLWTFKLRERPIAIGPRMARFELASALPFTNSPGDI